MLFVTCLIPFHLSVIADEGREVQALGLLDLSQYKTVPDSDTPTYLLHRDQLPPSGVDEDDLYDVNATPPVDCPHLSDDEREGYRQMAEEWRSKGTSYPKKAAAKLRRKQLTPPKVLSDEPVSDTECDCVLCEKGLSL